jgi:Transcription factor WhiB
MTPTPDPATIPTPAQEGPSDPRPAWERVAYTWLAREVDQGQPVDPTELAREVSVVPQFARDLLRLLRAQRDRDPGLDELRARLVRDQISDAYLARELAGHQQLDPAELAHQVGTTPTVARQWLAGLRAQHTSGQGLEVLSEPASHGHPTSQQLAGLQAHFAAGGHQHAAVTGRPTDAERLAGEVERHYWTREVRAGQRLRPLQLARELGGDQRQISQQLAELRAGPETAGDRIAQLWHAQQQDPAARPLRSSQLAWQLGISDSYVRHLTWQLRTRSGQAPLGERLAATHQRLTSPPPVAQADGERDWRLDAACADTDPELFFPETGQVPQAAAAKAVCAGCAVRGPCLEAALHGPQARDDHTGIFAGTTARQRVVLRRRPAMAEGTRFVHDRTAAEAALALADQVSVDRAARELGVSKQALRRAFDHHGLPQPQVFQGGPRRTRFYHDRAAAEQAWRRAADVGINQTRKELGVSAACCWPGRRAPARRPSRGCSPPRPAAPSTPSAPPTSPASGWGKASGAFRRYSTAPATTPPRSCSWTSWTRSPAGAAPARTSPTGC